MGLKNWVDISDRAVIGGIEITRGNCIYNFCHSHRNKKVGYRGTKL